MFSCVGSSLLRMVTFSSYPLLQCMGFSLWWLLLLQSMGSRCTGFSSCGMQLWLVGSRVQAQ